jgi:FkbM family methyltransferase
MTFVSYAQNFEDVMLWRALKRFTPGRYIDIGAQDPVVDSVSKAFHDAGWHGVHVEPSPFYAAALRQAFPEDIVIEAAVTANIGKVSFYEVPGGGLSTVRADIAQFHHDHAGHDPIERKVAGVTLAQILDDLGDDPIHWLKIDVEGLEREVLDGWGESARRPWIVVVESTFPTTDQPMHEEWENLITAKGYDLVYADGLNRFYLTRDQAELRDSFRYPPNVFDNFELSGTATSMTTGLTRRYEAELAERVARIDTLSTAVQQVSAERDRLRSAVAHQPTQRHLDQVNAATELQRLRAAERNLDIAVWANRTLEVEKEAAETKAAEAEEKLAAAAQSLTDGQLERDRLLERAIGAASANLKLADALEASKDRADQLADQLDVQRQFLAEMQTQYAQEVPRLLRDLDSRAEYITRLRDALEGVLLENEDLGARLSRGAGAFGIRLLTRLRLVRVEPPAPAIQRAVASQLLEKTPSSDERERQSSKDKRPMVEIVPKHVDQILTANGAEFVDLVYRAFLRRSPDRAGREHYIGRLRAGYGKDAVLLAIADSPEARALPCQLEGMDEFRARNAHKMRGWSGGARRLERSINRMEFSFGEMHARTEARINEILDRFESIQASFAGRASAPQAGNLAAADPGNAALGRRPLKDLAGDITATQPSQFIAELSEAVRQSSEAATFAGRTR